MSTALYRCPLRNSVRRLCSIAVYGTSTIGWFRKASEGLVGKARQDAEIGAQIVLKALARVPVSPAAEVAARGQAIRRQVANARLA